MKKKNQHYIGLKKSLAVSKVGNHKGYRPYKQGAERTGNESSVVSDSRARRASGKRQLLEFQLAEDLHVWKGISGSKHSRDSDI